VSNPIRYDSLLVRHLAAALDERLAGRPCRATPLRHGEHAALLPLDRGQALLFDLRPTRGWIRLVPAQDDGPALADATLRRVIAPADERRVCIDVEGGTRFRPLQRRWVIELHTNHWNLLVLDAEERIVFALRPRQAGGRVLRPGTAYLPPPPRQRLGPPGATRDEAWSAWDALLAATPPAQRARELQRRFAGLGPLSAAALAGGSGTEDGRRADFERWWAMLHAGRPEPVVLQTPGGPQPYPFPLPGMPSGPAADLLAAMERVAEATAPAAPPAVDRGVPVPAIEARLRTAEQRLQRLQEQAATADDPEAARHFGDLLLAHLAAVPRGADRVRLPDWSGGEVEIPLDPARAPAENATRWYDVAKRRARAAARLPELLATAESEARRWRRLLAAARDGTLDPAAVADLAPPTDRAAGAGAAEVRLPYRAFRTSGGLEVRVGRGSADNDRLTFGHSRPDDIWLHARSVSGSHVVLRWGNAEHAPPARDLAEAAGLAAWYSKARTSSLVPVDWTRRKHVRKPRGAPPGAVIPQRVKTVFVEPDPDLERRLGAGGAGTLDGEANTDTATP
jgi:predicted ribosome quality control (RQC) complex YloA/Tae2 family protein